MSAFDDYVEYVRSLFAERRLAPEYLPIRGIATSKASGTVDSGPGLRVRLGPSTGPVGIVLKNGRACLQFTELVEIGNDGTADVLTYTYHYSDSTYGEPLSVRFDKDARAARADHPEHHVHVQPLPCHEIRLPTGAVKLEQVLDLIAHQFGAAS